jgi:hypothetical protein
LGPFTGDNDDVSSSMQRWRGYYDLRLSTLALRATAVLVASLHGHGSGGGGESNAGSGDGVAESESLVRLGSMVEAVLVDYPYASTADRAVVASALRASFEDLAAMGALGAVLGRSGRAGVVLAAGRESSSRPQVGGRLQRHLQSVARRLSRVASLLVGGGGV